VVVLKEQVDQLGYEI